MQQQNKTEIKLRLNMKKFEDEEIPHKLFLTTKKTTKVRNAFANNMSTDIKPSQTYISNINSIRWILWFLVS